MSCRTTVVGFIDFLLFGSVSVGRLVGLSSLVRLSLTNCRDSTPRRWRPSNHPFLCCLRNSRRASLRRTRWWWVFASNIFSFSDFSCVSDAFYVSGTLIVNCYLTLFCMYLCRHFYPFKKCFNFISHARFPFLQCYEMERLEKNTPCYVDLFREVDYWRLVLLN